METYAIPNLNVTVIEAHEMISDFTMNTLMEMWLAVHAGTSVITYQ